MKEITKLRMRAEIVGCRVSILRRPYHFCGKTVRYEFIDSIGPRSASNLTELSQLLRRAENTFAKIGAPNDIFGRGVVSRAIRP
jgi:hypothetical protein